MAVIASLALVACADSSPSGSGAVFTTIDELQAIDVNAPINPYNAKANEFGGYNKMQLAWGKNSLSNPNDLYPGLAAKWSLSADGTALTAHLQPGAKWSDGTPVTSKDVKTSVALGISQGNNPVTVDIVDANTVTFTQAKGATSNTFTTTMLTIPIVPDSFFGSHIPASIWTDAATASDTSASPDAQAKATAAIASLGKELVGIGPKKDISAGPFTLTRVNPGEAVLAKNPHFYDAGKIDPTQVVLKSYSGNEQIWGYLKGNQLDAAPYTSTPANVLKSILAVKGIDSVSGLSQVSASLAFNQKVAPFDNVHVRRGIAYTIDRTTVTKIGEPTSGTASASTTGLIGASAKLFLGDTASALNPYNPDAAKASAEFTKAGLVKRDGKWMLPNGDPFTVNIQVPNGFSDWIAGGKSITTQLVSAGITSQLESSADYPTYLKDLADGKFAAAFWLTSLGPGPYAAFQRVYGNANGWNASGANVSHSPAGTNGNWIGSPETQQVNGTSVNPGQLAASLSHVPADEQKKIVGQLAALTNDQLPVIQLWDYVNVQFVNTNRFTHFPPENSEALRLSPGVWMQLGYIKKK
ncbi:ABC transporter substrate-binding protein [Lacisediminihabitans sp.]|uniref:ABC transporter substrate-binding protein n=1 Tax=Lacisediminihabitans sp. TaxID=2787631 RepID=UPI00374D5A76